METEGRVRAPPLQGTWILSQRWSVAIHRLRTGKWNEWCFRMTFDTCVEDGLKGQDRRLDRIQRYVRLHPGSGETWSLCEQSWHVTYENSQCCAPRVLPTGRNKTFGTCWVWSDCETSEVKYQVGYPALEFRRACLVGGIDVRVIHIIMMAFNLRKLMKRPKKRSSERRDEDKGGSNEELTR